MPTLEQIISTTQIFFIEFFNLLAEMSPYLLLGFLLAGILHVYFPKDKVKKFLGRRNFGSVLNASVVGVPLPLCSCGVIPTGVSFYRNGASKGASVSFLISTPQTGVDSILATYAILGLPFAIIRPIAAFISGIAGGWITQAADKSETSEVIEEEEQQYKHGKVYRMFHYAFIEFMEDIAKWLLLGLLIAAAMTVLIPDEFFTMYLDNAYLSILMVIVAAIPVYVCATGSIPIAAVLLMKGLSPGAAFALLMAGPATNSGTITVIGKVLGKKALFSYLFSIIAGAFITGVIMNNFLPADWFSFSGAHTAHHGSEFMKWFENISGIILLLMILHVLIRPYILSAIKKRENRGKEVFTVEGMTCNHCKANVEKNLATIAGIQTVDVDLNTGTVAIEGSSISVERIRDTVNDLGYKYAGRHNDS